MIFRFKATLKFYSVSPFRFKSQRWYFSCSESKTRPWKFVNTSRAAPWFPCTFSMHGIRRKTFFLGPQEFPKNMRRKQILIGLFAVIIYRTIEEPKKLQGGRERAFANTWFSRPAEAGTGISGVVFARPATAGTGANGLNILVIMTIISSCSFVFYLVHYWDPTGIRV